MRKFIVGAALLALASAPLSAQQAGQPVTTGRGSAYLGPYAGYMFFGDLFETSNNVEYSSENGALYGVQAGFSLSPNFSLLGNVGYTKSKFTAENVPAPTGTTTQNLSGDIGIWLYDANLQFRLPFMQANSWIAPLAQVGAGAIRYTQDYRDFNSKAQTDVAFNVGIGGDVQFAQAVGLRIMAKDYITSLNWSNDNSIRSDVFKGQTAHNWAVTVALNIGF